MFTFKKVYVIWTNFSMMFELNILMTISCHKAEQGQVQTELIHGILFLLFSILGPWEQG